MEVYLFGAGASRGYTGSKSGVQPPLAKDCFKVFNELDIAADRLVRIGHLVNYVRDTRGIGPLEFGTWNEDIESFLSEVVGRISHSVRKHEAIESLFLNMVYDQTIFLFNAILNEIQNGRVATPYRRLLRQLKPGDVLVTFNWDCLLDRALWESKRWAPDDGYGLHFQSLFEDGWRKPRRSARSDWQLLKLHGSTNWVIPYRTLDSRTGVRRYVNERIPASMQAVFAFVLAKRKYVTYENRSRTGYSPFSYFYYPPDVPFGSVERPLKTKRMQIAVTVAPDVGPVGRVKCDPHRGTSMPMIIPPVHKKEYDIAGGILEPLWTRASNGIQRCERLNICGYSFPPTDTRAWKLLTDAVSKRGRPLSVRVVDPFPDQLVTRLKHRLRKAVKVEVVAKPFEEFVRASSLQRDPNMGRARRNRRPD